MQVISFYLKKKTPANWTNRSETKYETILRWANVKTCTVLTRQWVPPCKFLQNTDNLAHKA